MRSIDDLEEELNEVAGQLNAQHARLAVLTRQLLDEPDTWASDGIWTVERYLCWRTGISMGHAKQLADIARRADELPECMEAFERGELSLDQATVLARKVPSWADVAATDLAKMLTVSQLGRSIGRYQFPHVPDAGSPVSDAEASSREADDPTLVGPPVPDGHVVPPENPIVESSCGAGCCGHAEPVDRCSFGFHDDGRFRLTIETDRVRGEIIEQALIEARDALFNDGQVDVTWVDALGEICDRSLDAIVVPGTAQSVPDQHAPRRRRHASATPPDTSCRTPSASTSPAMDCSPRCSSTTGFPSRSAGRNTSFPTAHGASWFTVMEAAASQGATSPTISKCTTSSTGKTTG